MGAVLLQFLHRYERFVVYVYLALTIVSRDALFVFVESQVANLSYDFDGAELGAKVGGIVTDAETGGESRDHLCFASRKTLGLSYNFYMVPNEHAASH